MSDIPEQKRDYTIETVGCDDQTTTVTIPLTSAEAEVVSRVAEAITAASSFSCMPRFRETRRQVAEEIAQAIGRMQRSGVFNPVAQHAYSVAAGIARDVGSEDAS